MKIRTQLVFAFLLLAIVPLSGIVLYSYLSSLAAVRGAVEEESRALTEEMDERLASVRQNLDLRFANLTAVPFTALLASGEEGVEPSEPVVDRLVRAMGDVAPLVESLEFVPAPAPPAPPAPASGQTPATPRAPAVAAVPRVTPAPAAASAAFGAELLPGIPGLDGDELHAVVIDVPRILAEVGRRLPRGQGPDEEAAIGLAAEVLGAMADSLEAEQGRLEVELERAEREGRVLSGAEVARHGRALAEKAEAKRRLAIELRQSIAAKRLLNDDQLREIEWRRKEQRLLLGGEFRVPVEEDGRVVGHVKACVASQDVLREILEASVRDDGEVPFAIDGEGTLHTLDDEESRALLEGLELRREPEEPWRATGEGADDWVVATSEESSTGLTFGIARPIRQSLAEVRRTAVRNFGYGMGLIVFGLVGLQPLSRRMTRQLETVARGAERIAQGDLQTRLPVRSRSEFGKLAEAFNRMARDLSTHQERLLLEESRRQEHELEEQLLRAEYRRKSEELEEARRFQLSLLPRDLPEHPALELAVAMTTATEVGGDFYDFHVDGGAEQGSAAGVLTIAVGDATGHGARAGTMVTVIKSLFSAYSGSSGPGRFLEESNRAIKRMELGRMAMALALARIEPLIEEPMEPQGEPGKGPRVELGTDRPVEAQEGTRGAACVGCRMTLASAGMPPALIHRRATGRVEEVILSGMPLGGLDPAYGERELFLDPGDTVLLLSDGLPELPDEAGEPLGYAAVRELFEEAAAREPAELGELIGALESAARRWAGTAAVADDRTFVVVRVKP
ncbi:MAG TPA: SpoIIE family protein phosphatase [Thermoanaerobaculia bacterium]|nr:SpoIIE family protein phosphatase [Thermoanaerobaculia bacterium]